MDYFNLKLNNAQVFELNEAIGDRFMFGKLSESEVFDLANNATKVGKNKKLEDVLPLIIKSGSGFRHLEMKDFHQELRYDLFESSKFNRAKVQNRKLIVQAIENGTLIPVITTADYKIPTSIPFIIKDGKPVVVYVNITDYVSLDQFSRVIVKGTRDLNNLMAVLYAAYLTQAMINSRRMYNNNELRILSRVYATMFAATIKSATSYLDTNTKLKMEYIGAKFFCIQLLGTERGEDVFFKNISPQYEKLLDTVSIVAIEGNISRDDYDTITTLITRISEKYPAVKINFGSFFDTWVQKFGPVTAMFDYVGYMIYIMCLYYFEAPMLNRHALATLVDEKMLNEFFSPNLTTI